MLAGSLAMQSLAAFFITLAAIVAGAPIARRCGLTDSPNARKRHQGEIPIIGGVGIFISLALTGFFWGDSKLEIKNHDCNHHGWGHCKSNCEPSPHADGECRSMFHMSSIQAPR